MTKEETAELLERFRRTMPEENPAVSEGRRGTGAVMHFLFRQDRPVPAGRISEATGVSTARIAVLLKKLEEKGQITRTGDPRDARKCLVTLSESGRQEICRRSDEFLELMSAVIMDMGKERFEQLIELSGELCDSMRRHANCSDDGSPIGE